MDLPFKIIQKTDLEKWRAQTLFTKEPETIVWLESFYDGQTFLDVGANIVAGTDPSEILSKAKIMFDRKGNWGNPFGDGTAASEIVNILMKK